MLWFRYLKLKDYNFPEKRAEDFKEVLENSIDYVYLKPFREAYW